MELWSIHPGSSYTIVARFFALLIFAPIHQFPLTNGTVWLICTCTNIRPCVTTTSFGTKHSIVILWQALLWFITFGKGKLLRCFLTMKDQVPLRFTGCKLLWIREPVVNRRRRVFRGAIIHNKLDFMGGGITDRKQAQFILEQNYRSESQQVATDLFWKAYLWILYKSWFHIISAKAH